MSRYETSNQFKDGLLMDLHPIQTPNTVLTDCLNGTFITYNGNEYSLQNDMGNFKLKNCKLKPGYLPIGTASYADTIYILSYNPIDDNVEFGSYPAPVQYGDSSDWKENQIWSVIENYIVNNFDDLEFQEKIKNKEVIRINQTDARSYLQKVIFGGDEFKLKRGDEYSLFQKGMTSCGFEEFNYEVVLDSGKVQKIIPNTDVVTKPVTWDTPGHIQISNRLLEIEQNSHRIVAKHVFKNKVEISILYEMFITDPTFIKKLDSGEISITSNLGDCVVFDSFAEYNNHITKGDVQSISINSWLGDYRKIECIIKFIIQADKDLDQKPVFPNNVLFVIQPEFHTSLTINHSNKDLEANTFDINFIQDEHTMKYPLDLENFKIDEIGNSMFYWDQAYLYANYTDINNYKPFYKIECYDNEWFETEWTEISIEPTKIKIPLSDGQLDLNNKFAAISFCYREVLDQPGMIESKPEEEGWQSIEDDSGKTFYYNTKLYQQVGSKYIKQQNENISTKILFVYAYDKMNDLWKDYCAYILNDDDELNDTIVNNKRYDLIPFDWIYKHHLSNLKLEKPIVTEGGFQTLHDEGATEGEFYNYFKRFEDTSIPYPSIVSNPPKSYKSDHCFEIPMNISFDCSISGSPSNFGFVEAEDVKKEIKIIYKDRKDLFGKREVLSMPFNNIVSFKNSPLVRIWNKINCSVEQRGDAFYFSDKLKFYQMKNVDDPGFRFDAVTLDKDGKGKNDFTVSCTIDNQSYKWKSLDIQNYRAIRMGYPEAWDDDSKGCRQMDFSGYSVKGVKNMGNLGTAFEMSGALAGIFAAEYITAALATSLSSLQSFNKRKLSGICNYIGNLHEIARRKLDTWKEPKAIPASVAELGKCEDTQAYVHTKCIATTFYRDKAQRPSFTSESGNINFYPDWDKWKKDGEDSGEERHVSESRTFLTFPVYDKMEMTKDREYWAKVSGSEQHSAPEIISAGNEFDGIGFVYSKNNNNPRWYVAWVPNWESLSKEDQNFKLCTQTTISHGTDWLSNDVPEWAGWCSISTNIPKKIIDLCKNLKLKYPDADVSHLPLLDKSIEIDGIDVWGKWDLPDEYFDSKERHCDEDYLNLKSHPIYKSFITAGTSASDRIKNKPIAGIYPDLQIEYTGDFFDSTMTNTIPWNNMYVDGKGRPFLTNLDPKENIYVCKNSKKQVFGYFPHVPIN